MTVAVVISIYDGVVLASDSATTMSHRDPSGETAYVNTYNKAEKVFRLSSTLPVGAVAYGLGNIGAISIAALFKEVAKRLDGRSRDHQDWATDTNDYTVERIAERVIEVIVDEHYAPLTARGEPAFGFGCKIAGYSAQTLQPEVWSVDFHGPVRPQPRLVRACGQYGVSCDGEPEAISRLLFGYSQQTVTVLKKLGVAEPVIGRFIIAAAETFQARLVQPPMPIADAAELAGFLVSLSCQFARFQPGAATVGGAAQIAVISAADGFKWINDC
jgi:hypothetical protein